VRPTVAVGIVSTVVATCVCAGPATEPATAPADAALWARLAEIDARAGGIQHLTATFLQDKFTALMKRPIRSTGSVRINGAVMRWDTRQPQESVLLIDQREAKVYYPAQKTLEIYRLDKRLSELAASPLPRLDVLRSRFSFRQISAGQLDRGADETRFLALQLDPVDPSLAQHVSQVRVLLDVRAGYIVTAEVTDRDGDRTVLRFSDVKLNGDVGDLGLTVPPGTAISHPLEGLDAQPPQS